MSDIKRSIRVSTGQHRQYLMSLAQMTPEQRLAKAFALSAMTKANLKEALRDRFPEKTEAELHQLFRERLRRCRSRNF
jgi:hypothetical protein